MIRVTHVLDPLACGDEGLMACAAACRVKDVDHEVWLVGTAADEHRARQYGVASPIRIPRCSGPNALMARRIQAVIRDRIDRVGSPVRTIIGQTWDLATASMVGEAWARRGVPRSTTLVRTPIGASFSSELAHLGRNAIGQTISVLDADTLRLLQHSEATSEGQRVLCRRVRVLPPPLWDLADGSEIPVRVEVRNRIGVAQDDVVVGLLSDPPEAGSASQLCAAIGLDHVLGTSTVAIVRRGTFDARRAARFTRANSGRWAVLTPDLSLLELIAASDVCVTDARAHRGASVNSCGLTAIMAAIGMGVPVVGVPECLRGWVSGEIGPPPLLIGSADRGAGRVAPPIHAAVSNSDLRVAHARETRAWLQLAKTKSRFEAELTAIWSESVQRPIGNCGNGYSPRALPVSAIA